MLETLGESSCLWSYDERLPGEGWQCVLESVHCDSYEAVFFSLHLLLDCCASLRHREPFAPCYDHLHDVAYHVGHQRNRLPSIGPVMRERVAELVLSELRVGSSRVHRLKADYFLSQFAPVFR